MATALQQPWIRTAVENELTVALNSFKCYVPGQSNPLVKDNRVCGPSGIIIRLKKARQAQVTEVRRLA
jgi:hypothetical protein